VATRVVVADHVFGGDEIARTSEVSLLTVHSTQRF
jgi:hypothetical protein